MSTALIIALVVVLVSGAGVGGYFLYKKLTAKETGSDKEKEVKKEEKVEEETKGKKPAKKEK
jgi:hypothetical protein